MTVEMLLEIVFKYGVPLALIFWVIYKMVMAQVSRMPKQDEISSQQFGLLSKLAEGILKLADEIKDLATTSSTDSQQALNISIAMDNLLKSTSTWNKELSLSLSDFISQLKASNALTIQQHSEIVDAMKNEAVLALSNAKSTQEKLDTLLSTMSGILKEMKAGYLKLSDTPESISAEEYSALVKKSLDPYFSQFEELLEKFIQQK